MNEIPIVLWYVNIGILIFGMIASIIFYRKAKNAYAIGLAALCVFFILGRLFALPVKFDLGEPALSVFNSDALLYLNIAFWSIIGLIFLLGGISLFKDKMKGKEFVGFWIFLVIASIIALYTARYLIETSVGLVPLTVPFTGTALLYEDLFLGFSWGGFLILFLCVEKNYSSKTRYFFTFLTLITLVFTLIENGTSLVTPALLILFMSSMAGMGLIFIFMAVSGLGAIRRNSINLIIGHLLLAFAFAFDVPAGRSLFAFLSPDLFIIVPPILHIFGLIFYYRGIFPLVFRRTEQKKSIVTHPMKTQKYFQGKTAVITGAASGIGREFALQLAQMGTNLVLSDINMERLEEAKQALSKYPVKVVATRCDVTKEQDVKDLVDFTLANFKNIDFLFSNAGIATGGPLEYITMPQWERIININLYGMIHCVRNFIPRMLEQGSGHVIVTSSIAGSLGVGGLGPYNATKFANSGFCESLYGEFKPRGINISIVSPFPLKTNLIETAGISIPPKLVDHLRPEVVKSAIEAGKKLYWEQFTAKKGLASGFCGGVEVDIAVENYLRKIARKKLYIFERWHGRFFQFIRGFWPGLYKMVLTILGKRNIRLLNEAYALMKTPLETPEN